MALRDQDRREHGGGHRFRALDEDEGAASADAPSPEGDAIAPGPRREEEVAASPAIFATSEARGGEEPVEVDAAAAADLGLAEDASGAVARIIAGAAPVAGDEIEADFGLADERGPGIDEHVAEGYLDMGETWGYTPDGRMRTVRDEVVEAPIEVEGKAPARRPAASEAPRKRTKASGARRSASGAPKRAPRSRGHGSRS